MLPKRGVLHRWFAMEHINDFLLEVAKLKRIPRTGWVFMGLHNPESVAEHIFRLALASWVFADKKQLKAGRAIKLALAHDLCEVYAGDVTTFLYHPEFQNATTQRERRRIEMKWARLSATRKKEIGEKKFLQEKTALERLLYSLPERFQNEVNFLWLDYERGLSQEGKLVHQLNSIEALLQSIEYFGTELKKSGTTWWEGTEEVVYDPLLVRFLETIQARLYEGKQGVNPEGLGDILDFLRGVGTIKKVPRKGWIIRGVKSPETMGNHGFMLAMMAWAMLSNTKDLRLDENTVIKMALCTLLPHVFVPEITPYDGALRKTKSSQERKVILSKWVRSSVQTKRQLLGTTRRKGELALKKLTKGLEDSFRKDLLRSWQEFCENKTPEAHFVNQVYALELLLRALQYWEEDKKFPVESWWEWAFEFTDSDFLSAFVEDVKQRFRVWDHVPA